MTIEVHGRFAGGPDSTWVGVKEPDSQGEPASHWELLIAFSPTTGCVTRERFKVDTVIYDTDHVEGFLEKDPKLRIWCPVEGSQGWSVELQRTSPALGQLQRRVWRLDPGPRDDASWEQSEEACGTCRYRARGVARLLANIQRVEPELPMLRAYSRVAEVPRMGERGENFAALVQTICKGNENAYLSWLKQLRPEEVDHVGVLHGAIGEPLFMLREKGREFPAAVLSDGTLRFAALAAAFFQPDMPDLMTIEEIENGLHSSRARLLLELLRSQAEAANTQVVATTHSAAVLDWLGEEDYRTTFVCKRDEETGESRICALTDVPHFVPGWNCWPTRVSAAMRTRCGPFVRSFPTATGSSTSGCSSPTAITILGAPTQWGNWKPISNAGTSRCCAVRQSRRSRSTPASTSGTTCPAGGRTLAPTLG